jgi:hypothetical protein
MEEIKIVTSAQGKKQIQNQGHTLCLNKCPIGSDTSYFRCIVGKGPTKCNAMAAVIGDLDMDTATLKYHRIENHSHPPDNIECLVKRNLATFQDTARENIDKGVKRVYEDVVLKSLEALDSPDKETYTLKLPAPEKVLMRGYRARYKDIPTLPKSLSEVTIVGRLSKTLNDKPYYRGKTNKECHTFMSKTQCEIASQGDKLFIDGAFSSVPEPFNQVLITRTKVRNKAYTTSYTLVPNKQQKTYE